MKISFLGDVSLNNRYNLLYDQNKKPFNNVSNILHESDHVIGNLECLSVGIKENILKRPRLKTNKNTLNYLSDINMDKLSLLKNHKNYNPKTHNLHARFEQLFMCHIYLTL